MSDAASNATPWTWEMWTSVSGTEQPPNESATRHASPTFTPRRRWFRLNGLSPCILVLLQGASADIGQTARGTLVMWNATPSRATEKHGRLPTRHERMQVRRTAALDQEKAGRLPEANGRSSDSCCAPQIRPMHARRTVGSSVAARKPARNPPYGSSRHE